MRPLDRLRRWWNPAQWRDDHPDAPGARGVTGTAAGEDERAAESTRDERWWNAGPDLFRTRRVPRRPGRG